MVSGMSVANRPKFVFESWPPQAQLWAQGPIAKACVTRWKELGFSSRCRFLQTTQHGGAIVHNRLVVVRCSDNDISSWTWPVHEPGASVVRPMGNLLTPPGLVRCKCKSSSSSVPDASVDPMPGRPGTLIRTARGVRRLQVDEVV